MKLIFTTLIAFFLFTSFGFAQNNCSKFYPMDEGTIFQYTNYSKKGKISGIIDHSITDNRTENGNEVVSMTSKMSDKKGKLILESSHDITCNGDVVFIDYKSLISPQMMSQFGEFDYEVSGTNLELPNNLSVGLELPDSSMNMIVSMGITMNITVTIKDRKVVGQESITTPSGTYDCYVLTSTLDMDMMMKIEGSSKQWIAEGVGMVKQESYDDKGKQTGYSELTKFEN